MKSIFHHRFVQRSIEHPTDKTTFFKNYASPPYETTSVYPPGPSGPPTGPAGSGSNTRPEVHRPRNTDLIDKCQTTKVVLQALETQVSTCGKMLGDG